MESKNKRNLFPFYFLIIFLAIFLRLLNLDAKNLWYDEVASIANALKKIDFIFLQPICNYKPVYILLLKTWIGIFGIDGLSTRLLSVFFGVFSVLVIFKIGEYLFNKQVGLISSFLLSISCFHIYHSQQVRHYTFISLLVSLSFFYFIKFLNEKKVLYLAINSILNILIIYTHPYGLIFILVELLYIIYITPHILDKTSLKKLLFFQIPLFLILGLLFLLMIMNEEYFKTIHWWVRKPNISSLIEAFQTFCYGGPRYGLDDVKIKDYPSTITNILTFIFGVLFIKGLFAFTKFCKVKVVRSFFIIWLLLPIAFTFLFSYIFYTPLYLIKHLLVSLPAFYIIIANGLYGSKSFSMPALLIVSLLNIIPLKVMYTNNANIDWGKAVLLMKQQDLKDNSIIIITTCKEIMPFIYYFSNANKGDLVNIGIFGKFINGNWQESFLYKNHYIITLAREVPWIKEYNCSYIMDDFEKKVSQNNILDMKRQIWLLISRWTVDGEDYCEQAMADKIKKHYKLRLEKEAGGIKVFCFEPQNY